MFDCGFTKENNWFRYRTAAIIVENDCVLLATNDNVDYYYSVGGGVQMGEKAEDAVVREVFEETGVHYEIDRLAVIHENFFIGSETLKDFNCHEIALYSLMKPRGTQELNSNSFTQDNIKEGMVWIPIDDLDKHTVYPTFLKEYLSNKSTEILHTITDEKQQN